MPKLNFCNVDLEMMFAKEPKVLLRELGRKVTVLYAAEQELPVVKIRKRSHS